MASTISKIAQIDTKLNADSVEWCPTNPPYFVCGTYQLIEGITGSDTLKSSENNSRIGSIILFKYDSAKKSVTKLQTIYTAAVTDMKWYNASGESLLAVTGSSGKIDLYSFIENNGTYKLENLSSLNVCTPNLSLSLDWARTEALKVAISDSGGCVSVVDCSENGCGFSLHQKWKAHNFDAWITAFDCWNKSVVYSGGDDCLLKSWDIRTQCHKPIFVNKSHTMGVCAIQGSSLSEHVFTTGSYDEQVYVWDMRSMAKPLASCDLGGGIWRLKWHPKQSNYLLAACCHSGFHVLHIDRQSQGKVAASYTSHNSLAYGADWSRHSVGCDDEFSLHEVIATCSFYDHRLDLWELQILPEPNSTRLDWEQGKENNINIPKI